MGTLKTMFTNKFRKGGLPVVFQKEHWSKILCAVCKTKMEYFNKNNTNLTNTKQREGKWLYLFVFYIHALKWIIFMMVLLFLWLSCFIDDYMIIIILNI